MRQDKHYRYDDYRRPSSRWSPSRRVDSDYSRSRSRSRDDYRRKNIDLYNGRSSSPRVSHSPIRRSRPSLVISKKCLPFVRGALEELEKMFFYYNCLDVSVFLCSWGGVYFFFYLIKGERKFKVAYIDFISLLFPF